MSGFMWQGIGQGIANAGTSIASAMTQAERDRERAAERAALQEERLAAQREMKQMAIDAKKESGGGDKTGAMDFTPGSIGETAAAARMGMSVPEFRTFLEAEQRGGTVATPAGIKDPEAYQADKRRALGEIATEFGQGKNYKDTTEGRQRAARAGVEADIAAGKVTPEAGGAVRAAQEGKDLYQGGEKTTTSKFTGKSSTTAVGEQDIKESKAKAEQARAAAAKSRADAGDVKKGAQLRAALSTELQENGRDLRSAEAKLKDPLVQADEATRAAAQEEVDALRKRRGEIQQELGQFKESMRTPPGATPKKTDNAGSTSVLNTLPPGARQIGTSGGKPVYELPDGTRFIQR